MRVVRRYSVHFHYQAQMVHIFQSPATRHERCWPCYALLLRKPWSAIMSASCYGLDDFRLKPARAYANVF